MSASTTPIPEFPAARIVWFSTKGSGTNDARRIEYLLGALADVQEIPFDKCEKWASFFRLLRALRVEQPALLVMEGTGLAGGLACIVARLYWRIPYVVSSGDAVGPFMRAHHAILGLPFVVYEWLLCRWSAGFIGWTPYLCGRALTFGAPRAMTAAGWSGEGEMALAARHEAGLEMRRLWGIPNDAIVVGLVGSLGWNTRRRYCYGWDLVEAARRLARTDLVVCVVGDGTGLSRLRELAGDQLGKMIFVPGAVAADHVPAALAAMDVGSLPQSVDGVGSFRYTTKLSEYLDAGLPVITNQIPMAYDLDSGWLWRLPGVAPWDEKHLAALRILLQQLQRPSIDEKRDRIRGRLPEFDPVRQRARVTAFLLEMLEGLT